VDTGIHHKQWTREKAIDYLRRTTPNAEGDIAKAVERYIVDPGQATAYTVGLLRIRDLRRRAEQSISDLDLREFHDVVLASGPLPLDILSERVQRWIVLRQRD
jgi:uncharacterized protein (DUF885 family)